LAGGLLAETAWALGIPLATTLPPVGEQPKRPNATTRAAAGAMDLHPAAIVVSFPAVIC
jgi:hypothetical protein